MDGDKRSGPLLEFSLLMLLIAFAVIFAWNLDLSSFKSSEAPPIKTEDRNEVHLSSAEEQRWKEGKDLFKSSCASCHHPKIEVTGPPLEDVRKRWEAAGDYKGKNGREWLKLWIKNWNEPVKEGYPYAVSMANSRKGYMNIYTTLKDEQIDNIMMYVDSSDIFKPKVQMSTAP